MLGKHLYSYADNFLKLKNCNYLEIGVFDGDGLCFIAERHPDKIIFGLDPFIEDFYTSHITNVKKGDKLTKQEARARYRIKKYKNISLFVKTSQLFKKELEKFSVNLYNIGVIIIDGSHHYSDVLNDLYLSFLLIKESGYVIMDDVNIPDVISALVSFEKTHGKFIYDKEKLDLNTITFKIVK